MSHFKVAVITHGTKTVEELMAPYQENNMGDVPRKFLKFCGADEDERGEYENGTYEFVRFKENLLSKYDDTFKKTVKDSFGFDRAVYEVPDGLPIVEIPYKMLYPTIDDYLRDHCGYSEVDPRDG